MATVVLFKRSVSTFLRSVILPFYRCDLSRALLLHIPFSYLTFEQRARVSTMTYTSVSRIRSTPGTWGPQTVIPKENTQRSTTFFRLRWAHWLPGLSSFGCRPKRQHPSSLSGGIDDGLNDVRSDHAGSPVREPKQAEELAQKRGHRVT